MKNPSSSTKKSDRKWEDVTKDYEKKVKEDFGNLSEDLKKGMAEAVGELQQIKVASNGDLMFKKDTINFIAPMEGMLDGLEQMGESLKIKTDDMAELRKSIKELPALLQSAIEIFSTMELPTTKGDNKGK